MVGLKRHNERSYTATRHYLLDTNPVALAVDGTSIVGQRIFEARLSGGRLGTCVPVLCEIEASMRQVRNKAKYRRDLNHLMRQLSLWPIGARVAHAPPTHAAP